jgi:hypothetical protein
MTSHFFSLDMPNEIHEMFLLHVAYIVYSASYYFLFSVVVLSLDGLCRSTAQSVLAALSFICFMVHGLLFRRDDCL